MLFEVEEIIDYEKIRIKPDWCWNDAKGNIVKINSINGVKIDKFEEQLDKTELIKLLFDKLIELKCPEEIEENIILCDIELA